MPAGSLSAEGYWTDNRSLFPLRSLEVLQFHKTSQQRSVNMQAVENKRRLAPSSDKSLSLEKLSDIQENIIQLPVQKIMSLLTIHEVTLRI